MNKCPYCKSNKFDSSEEFVSFICGTWMGDGQEKQSGKCKIIAERNKMKKIK